MAAVEAAGLSNRFAPTGNSGVKRRSPPPMYPRCLRQTVESSPFWLPIRMIWALILHQLRLRPTVDIRGSGCEHTFDEVPPGDLPAVAIPVGYKALSGHFHGDAARRGCVGPECFTNHTQTRQLSSYEGPGTRSWIRPVMIP